MALGVRSACKLAVGLLMAGAVVAWATPADAQMTANSAIRDCSGYSEHYIGSRGSAQECYDSCAGYDAVEWHVDGACYCERGSGCNVQGGFGGWYAGLVQAAPPPPPPSGSGGGGGAMAYQGCFTDDGNRALPAYQGAGYSLQSCNDRCGSLGYAYSGSQWYDECFCGNSVGYSQVGDGECNTPCNSGGGNCGGAWRNSIYATGGGGGGSSEPPPSGGGDGGGAFSPSQCGTLLAGETLPTDNSLESCDGSFRLAMQSDGNLVVYEGGSAIWANYVFGSNHRLQMQGDGNLVVYNGANQAVWASNTSGGGARLSMQTDGNLVVYDSGSNAMWASGVFYERGVLQDVTSSGNGNCRGRCGAGCDGWMPFGGNVYTSACAAHDDCVGDGGWAAHVACIPLFVPAAVSYAAVVVVNVVKTAWDAVKSWFSWW